MVIFPDTNILLHYPPLAQVDWCKLCNTDNVKLVICMQVIRELDAKKSDSRLRDRATRALQEIRSIRNSGPPVRDGVMLDVFIDELRPSNFADGVIPNAGDLRIIQHVKNYLKNSVDKNAAICTEDVGMMLHCEVHTIPVVELDKETRLPNPQAEDDRKYKSAIVELNELKHRLSDLHLTAEAADANGPTDELNFAKKDPQKRLNVAELLDKVREENPFLQRYHPSHGLENYVSDDQVDKYNEKLEIYFKDFEAWVQRVNLLFEARTRMFRIILTLKNEGNGPAEDVDIHVTFPPDFVIIEVQDSDELRTLMDADPPEPPEVASDLLMQPIDLSNLGPKAVYEDEPELTHIPDGTHVFHAHLRGLKHSMFRQVAVIVAAFKSWESIRTFEAPYRIVDANHPKPFEGKLVIKAALKE
jgi:hypothetical protein